MFEDVGSTIKLGGSIMAFAAVIAGILSLYVLITTPIVQEERNQKIEYALENGYKFYYDGEDITHKVENMDLDNYTISFDKYDEGKVMLSEKRYYGYYGRRGRYYMNGIWY